jgi:putative endonuclease
MGYMYILKCCDGTYYTGSTVNLELRLKQHQNGEGAIYTRNRLPLELVYFEEYGRIDEAFYREKQVQNWSRKKKEAFIEGRLEELPLLAKKIWKKYGTVIELPRYAPFGATRQPIGRIETRSSSSHGVAYRDDRIGRPPATCILK